MCLDERGLAIQLQRFNDAMSHLDAAIRNRGVDSLVSVPDLDVNVCLAVRDAFTAFIDYFGWLDEQAARDEKKCKSLRGAMERAHAALVSSEHEDADKFRTSIHAKIELLDRIKAGLPLKEVFA